MREASTRHGFTLLEMLLSTVLLLMVLTQIAQIQAASQMALGISGRGRMAGRRAAGDATTGRRLFSADCRGFVVPGTLPEGEPAIDLVNEEGQSKVTFHVAQNGPAGSQGIRKVTWSLQEGSLARLDARAGSEAAGEAKPLLGPIDSLGIQLGAGGTWVTRWQGQKGLPTGLKLTIGRKGQAAEIWEAPFWGGVP